MPNGQIQTLDERRIHGRRVLRVRERVVKPPGSSDHHPSVDPHDAVMATRLDHLRVERRRTEDPTDHRPVELEAIGHDHGTGGERHPRRHVANECQGVPVAAASDDGRRPETRPDLNRREHPRRPSLPPSERADFVGLQLLHREACGPPVAKSTAHGAGPLEPAGDGVPGQPFDSGDRR